MNNVVSINRADPELRTPPANIDAERALLGAILVNNKALDQVVDFLKPHHFADPAAERVFAAVLKLVENGTTANVLTLKSFLESDEIVNAAGGFKYLAALSSPSSLASAVRTYGEIIHDLYLRRELIAHSQEMSEDAFRIEIDRPAKIIMEDGEERLFNLGSSLQTQDRLSSIAKAGDEAIELAQIAHRRNGDLVGITTGLSDLDKQMGGLHPSDLIIIAGRPSMGKTALATAMAFNAAKYFQTTKREEHAGKQVVFASLEMSASQLANRVLARLANVNSHNIRTGRLSNDDMHRLVSARSDFVGVPLHIDDTPGATVNQIRTRCRRLARQKGSKGLGLVVIDYLQLMDSSRDDKAGGRVNELGAMTRGLKKLAKDLNVPVICLSQLSRAVEQRDDKRPQLADLRESGTIEQDADVVMFVYREEYYLARQQPQQKTDETPAKFIERDNRHTEKMNAVRNIAEVIISKQRHGPIGTVPTHFDGPTTWFSDLAKEQVETRYMQGMD